MFSATVRHGPARAQDRSVAAAMDAPVVPEGMVGLVVAGAHLRGVALDHEVVACGGTWAGTTRTAARYALRLDGAPGAPPALPDSRPGDDAGERRDRTVWLVADGNGEDRPIGTRVKLTDVSSRAWEHPADRGALTALRQLRGFDYILRKLAGLWNERALRLVYLGTAVRVDHRQFPRVYQLYTQAADTLDVHDLPLLYVYSNPRPHAMALGIDHPFVIVNSGMLDLLDDDELRFVLGHELGHVLSGHALYTTMLLQLLRVSNALSWLPIGAFGLRAVIAALYEWSRKAELSSDRAGLLATQDPATALRCHMKLASGGRLDELDIAAFRAQGEEYLGPPDVRDSVLKLLLLENATHPFAVVRAAELQRWVDSGGYTQVLQGSYPRRSEDKNASMRSDAADAADHYRRAFEHSQDPLVAIVRDLGGTVAGIRDRMTSFFTNRDDGPHDDSPRDEDPST